MSEVATLGAIDDPVLAFASINDLAVAEHVFVLQTRIREVTELTRAGRLVRRIGRGGEGPGEFVTPTGIGLRSDTLWVLDNGRGRVSYFFQGELIREEPYRSVELRRGENLAAMLPLTGELFLGIVARDFEYPAGDPRNSFALVRIEDGAIVDSIAHLKESSPFRVLLGNNSVAPPVSDFPLFRISPQGDFVVVVERPLPDGPVATIHVTKISAHGDTLFTKRISRPAAPYPRAQWDRDLDDRFAGRQYSFTREEYEAAIDRAEWHVPVSRFEVGDEGWMWVAFEQLDEKETVEWLILDSSGMEVAETTLPSAFRAYAVTRNEIWGVVRDELDVPYVRGYALDLERD